MQTSRQFHLASPATHFGIDAEDVQEAVQFDHQCQECWPVWVLYREGQPVAWWDESADIAHLS